MAAVPPLAVLGSTAPRSPHRGFHRRGETLACIGFLSKDLVPGESLKTRLKLESEVAECLRAGDVEGAAARVVQAFGPGVSGYLRVALTDERAARDAFSAFSQAVWEGLRRKRGERALEVWAYRLAFAAAKQLRNLSKRRRPSQAAQRTGVRELARTRPATLEPLGVVEDAELLRRELSLEEQTLLTLRIDRGMDYRDIGWVLGRTATEASVRRSYERMVLRLHRVAVTRGVIAPGPVPGNLNSLSSARRSGSRER